MSDQSGVSPRTPSPQADFLAKLSGALNGPLSALLRATVRIAPEELPEDSRDQLDLARASVERLQMLGERVEEFIQVDAASSLDAPATFQLEALMTGVLRELAPRAEVAGLTLTHACPPGLPKSLSGDPTALRVLLRHLLASSLRQYRTGVVGAWAHLLEREGEALKLEFSVGRDRRGLSPEDRSDPNGDEEATVQSDPLLAVDLALAARLVERLGGELAEETDPALGPRYRFTLDFRPPVPPGTPPSPSAALADLELLCVTETENRYRTFRESLEQWRIHCRGMVHPEISPPPIVGPEAWSDGNLAAAIHEELRRSAASATPYGALILETRFPSGWCEDLAQRLREDGLLAELCLGLIVNGGIQSEVQRDHLLEVGFDFVLNTPLHPERLHDALVSALAHRGREQESQRPSAPAALPDEAPGGMDESMRFETMFNARLLLVDDNPASARIHRAQLETLGCAIDEANTGFQTFEMAGDEAYDAILLDGDMQERDGYASVRSLRNREGTVRRTPLIALSVKASEIERQYYMAKDLDDCVKKPLVLEDLRGVLCRWIPPAKQYMGSPD